MLKNLGTAILGVVVGVMLVGRAANAQDDLGEKIALCSACHGQNGEPVNGSTPVIWGQQGDFLYKELHDYHSGERDNPIMSPLAKNFSLQDLRGMADYFAAKPWPARPPTAAAAAEPEGTAMCKACHGQHFEGTAAAPRLAGEGYAYLVGSMNAFADGSRTNNLDMQGFMKPLMEKQREAIAHYLAAL